MTQPVHTSAVLPSGGAWLRLFLALAVVGVMSASWIPTPFIGTRLLELATMVILGIWVVARPGSGSVLVLAAGVLAVRIFHGQAVIDGQLIVLVVLVPLISQLAAVAAVVPLRSTLHWWVLLPTAARYAGSVLVTVLVLGLATATGIA